jgi:hypothetical protein
VKLTDPIEQTPPVGRANANPSPNDPICVADAGAVLLWPYLPRFFDQIGLLEESAFLNAEARVRGVMLVQYLVTGSTEAEELQLTLPKILCGVPLETIVPLHINLTEQERSVSEDLLNAVCKSWPPLNNSSTATLRKAFLQRRGWLTETEPNIYTLDVSPEPYDMLLDRLPWQINMIMLGFMPAPMSVHWGGP